MVNVRDLFVVRPLAMALRWFEGDPELSRRIQLLTLAPRGVVETAIPERLQIFVNPAQIVGVAHGLKRERFVVHGDWDIRRVTPIEQTLQWQVMSQTWHYGTNWRSSEIYGDLRLRFDAGYRGGRDNPFYSYSCIDAYFETRLELLRSCAKAGIWKDPEKPLRVAIGRSGDLYKTHDGMHRLCAALVTGCDLVPARVVNVHSEYAESFLKHLDAQ